MKINLLKSEVYNQIAAGEVVEKPFNVVKELVENSIDAGATQIKIEIQNGGIDLIRITDNGIGIEKDDIQKAFLPHATSKIKNIDDLQKILTLGFRGEALSSIASVSKINLKTKTESDKFGTEAENIAGNIVSMSDVGLFTGTVFEVKDLFFNVPARRKFLKKAAQEESDIKDYVERLILSHPEISFNLIINSKQIYNFKSSDLENAIFTVYGKEVYSNLIKIDAQKDDNGETRLSGFVGKPAIAKGNKNAQSLFINGRYVKNQTVYSAVGRAFEAYLMKGKYPFYVLNLSVPASEIDVNVHPTKQDIRFQDTSSIFSFVYRAVTQALLGASKINLDDALDNLNVVSKISQNAEKPAEREKNENLSFFKDISLKDEKPASSSFDSFVQNALNSEENARVASSSEIEASLFSDMAKRENGLKTANENQNEPAKFDEKIIEKIDEKKPILNDNFEIVGTVFKTYIIIEEQNQIHLIDQHAAHERLLFNKLTSLTDNVENLPKQQLLVPFVKTFSPSQAVIMQEGLEALKSIGLEFENFGKNTYKLSEIPMILSGLNLDEFLGDMFENNRDLLANLKASDIVRSKLATFACKSAIKAGTTLSKDEIAQLIDEMKRTNTVLLCPHGRPIVVTISKKDLEKWFKRIV